MKLALLNAFPNLRHSAEREFVERCLAVLGAMGHQARSVLTSDDIVAFDPDLVIVTHEFAAKTTDHYTVGLLWSPTRFYRDDEERLKAIRSWDLVVPINAQTRRVARDLHFPLRHRSAVSDLDFYPSAAVADLPLPDPARLSLAYVGAHWDGPRHRALLEALAQATDLHVYGPAAAWAWLPRHYRGPVDFDGQALVQTLNRHGVVLALHKPEHVQEHTPSMRVFEACAARCTVITEALQPLRDLFGDAIDTIDPALPPQRLAAHIAGLVDGYRRDPARHAERATRLHEAFRARASLEHLLAAVLDEVAARQAAACAVRTAQVEQAGQADEAAEPAEPTEPDQAGQAARTGEGPEVAVIIRCGARPLAVLQRAVASVAAQTHARIGLVLVRFAEIEGWPAWLQATRASGRFSFVTEVAAPGNGVRSTALWAGLQAVRAGTSELLCLLDDDDEWFRQHLAQLLQVLQHDPGCDIAYAGAVRQEEDGVHLNHHPRFKGDLGLDIAERRALVCMDDFSLDRLLRFDNFILSHAWLARRAVLTAEVLDDPGLEVSEDLYLTLLWATRHRFQFSGRVSVLWNWRSNASDNSMRAVAQQRWADGQAAIARRLAQVVFPGGYAGREVLTVGRLPRGGPGGAQAAGAPAAGAAPSRPLLRRLLRLASGGRAFVAAGDPPPCDPATVVRHIDFTQRALPDFITRVRGLSDFEGWGCWTDGPVLSLQFSSPLPPRFTLHLVGHASPGQHHQPVTVTVGGQQAVLRMSARWRACRYRVSLDNPEGARTLEFHIPGARSPVANDAHPPETRRLGIGLVRLDIATDPAGD